MKAKLLILLSLCFFACKEDKVEPRTQAQIIYPIVDAVYIQDNLYIILPDGVQYIAFNNKKSKYIFFYDNKKIEFDAVSQGYGVIITYNGVDIKCKTQFRN